jgi:hypothetical protein
LKKRAMSSLIMKANGFKTIRHDGLLSKESQLL